MPQRDRAPIRRGAWAMLAARAVMLFGGVALAIRFALPAAKTMPLARPAGYGRPDTPPSHDAWESGHETRDLDARTLTRLVIGLGVVVVAVVCGLVLFRNLIRADISRNTPPLTAQQLTRVRPQAPTLQANPVAELEQFNHREDQLLMGYAWLDPAHTQARIPLARAMTLIVGHPLDAAP